MNKQLVFNPIDLDVHRELCVTFRRDSFACSFTDGADRFTRDCGSDGSGYIAWLREKSTEFPLGFVHGWHGDQILGQLELRIRPDGTGYANLFYLAPQARGGGWGDSLNAYALHFFRSNGASIARLSVAPNNLRAVTYYRKHQWRDAGPRADCPNVSTYEISL